MKAVITVIGKDVVGILAKVSMACAEYNVNIINVTQSVVQDVFAMIMMLDISTCNIPFDKFSDKMKIISENDGLSIQVMHEDIINSMLTIKHI